MRGHFDWWDNMESDIAMKTKTTASTSTIPITVPEQVFVPISISYTYLRRYILTVAALFRRMKMLVLCASSLNGGRTSRMILS